MILDLEWISQLNVSLTLLDNQKVKLAGSVATLETKTLQAGTPSKVHKY